MFDSSSTMQPHIRHQGRIDQVRRAQLYEKPTRMLSLFNALELGFEAPRSA